MNKYAIQMTVLSLGSTPIDESYKPIHRWAEIEVPELKNDKIGNQNLRVALFEVTGTPQEIIEKAKANVVSILAMSVRHSSDKSYEMLVEEFSKY